MSLGIARARHPTKQGISASAPRGQGTLCSGEPLCVRRSTISANARHGIYSYGRTSVARSYVMGNGGSSSCTLGYCGDILSWQQPRVRSTICGYSLKPSHDTWGVCTYD